MSETWSTVIGLAAVIVLVAANGLFVATEFAYVAVRRTRIEQLASTKHSRARLLLAALHDLDNYIAATQLGITMSSLALGWVGEPALAHLIRPPVEALFSGWAASAVAHGIAVAIAFAVITSLHIVLGELAPKTLALQRTEAVALWVVAPITVFNRIFRPFIWLMNEAGRAVVRPFGIRPAHAHEENLAPDELELVIEASARAGLLSTSELLLARRALEFSAIQADQIMVPRTEVVALDSDADLAAVLATMEGHQHTRYPVYENDLDHILGIVDVKDLLMLVSSGGTEWRPLVRPAVAIPEAVSVEVAVAEMRARQVQMLVLVDEHGGTSGILTADELLYRLLGRWLGAGRQGGDSVRALAAGNLLVSGLALIEDIEDATGAELADEDYDTVGGFVMARLGRIPRVGDRIEVPGYQFRVMAMDGRRVDRVLVVKASLERETVES
ncbi:HlyC/CorC family transporter [bacterium]|jgi:CBS domain containing-hemolysin-like protein|nr:HlyC/CorC family transporter [bacterium]